MLYFYRIDVFEGIDVNKTSKSKVGYLSLLVLFIESVSVSTTCML